MFFPGAFRLFEPPAIVHLDPPSRVVHDLEKYQQQAV